MCKSNLSFEFFMSHRCPFWRRFRLSTSCKRVKNVTTLITWTWAGYEIRGVEMRAVGFEQLRVVGGCKGWTCCECVEIIWDDLTSVNSFSQPHLPLNLHHEGLRALPVCNSTPTVNQKIFPDDSLKLWWPSKKTTQGRNYKVEKNSLTLKSKKEKFFIFVKVQSRIRKRQRRKNLQSRPRGCCKQYDSQPHDDS